MAKAIAIPLDIWRDPQGDIVLVYSEMECSIYFACWKAQAEPADFLGHLSFSGASAVRSFRREFLPYQIQPHALKSCILEIPDSDFAKEHLAYRRAHYPDSPGTQYVPKHFVVDGHDIYHEILAKAFVASAIPCAAIADPRLKRLIEYA